MTCPDFVPSHLRKYVVDQSYEQYTPIDQAVWRYIMRQLRQFLATHAHPCYLEGLVKTGTTIDTIPHIDAMSAALEKFGWRAVPVSGFLPPAAFMELQAQGILPIGAAIRSLDHLLYTPAPDIVHEAAGHAPILIDPEFSDYLKKYAQVANKSILNHEDMALYEAIRVLSDLKEDPTAKPAAVAAAEHHLTDTVAALGAPSEGALVARMNWWTVEYGLIGSVDRPLIYGAGLLSSLGECRWCLESKVKKLPMSLACADFAYDITEPQPQLFVAPDFATLSRVIDEFANRMAFKRGGMYGLTQIRDAKTINTAELNSGVQISGVLEEFLSADDRPMYLRFAGPSQLSYRDAELPGHDIARHAHGFGTPVGRLQGATKCLSQYTLGDLKKIGAVIGQSLTLHFDSGVTVSGVLKNMVQRDGKNLIFTFTDCRVTHGERVLFDPAWGEFDMVIGEAVTSCFGGAADRNAYGETQDFVVQHVPTRTFTKKESALMQLYTQIRELRERPQTPTDQAEALCLVLDVLGRDHPDDWLLRVEILELSHQLPTLPAWQAALVRSLQHFADEHPQWAGCIHDGIALAQQTITSAAA